MKKLFGRNTRDGVRSAKRRTIVRWADSEDYVSIASFQRALNAKHSCSFVVNRSPDWLQSYATEGLVTKFIIAEDPTSKTIKSCAALSYKELYLNGRSNPWSIGYLGSLLSDMSNPRVLTRGFELIDSIQEPDRPDLWLTTIFKKNSRALRTIGSGRAIFGSRYSPLGTITSFVMKATAVLSTIRASSVFTMSDSINCDAKLAWHGYPSSVFLTTPNLELRWQSVHTQNHTRAVGALLNCQSVKRWQLQAADYKQLLYSLALKTLSFIRNTPSLSDLSRLVFLHGVTSHPDDREAYESVIRQLALTAIQLYGNDVALCIGIHSSSPMLSLFHTIPSLHVESELFRVILPRDNDITLDNLPWHIDIGTF
jgi:hypothetical protein